MSITSAKKIGFFTALSMTLGSVVGIGIFLKNSSIIKYQMDGAPVGFEDTFSFWSMIVSWIISTIISLCMALSFAEISTCRNSKSGLSGWVEQLGGYKIGRTARVSHNNFYYAIFVALLPFLAVEGLYKAIDMSINGQNSTSIHFYLIFIGGFIIISSLFVLNFFSLKGSSIIQNSTMILKIIPIVLVAIIGLCNANNSVIIDQDVVSNSANKPIATPSTEWFSINGMFFALPAVLFSFDAFLNIGNLSTEIKNPKRNVPLIAVLTIVIAAIIYILIAIGSGLTGLGSAGDILKTIFPGSEQTAREAIDIIINIFITISAIGSCNAMVVALLRSSDGIIETRQIMFANQLHALSLKKHGLGPLVLSIISTSIYFFIFGITAIILDNDAVIDGATNAPILIFFFVYALTIAMAIKDRFTKKQCQKIKGFMICAPIAVVGTLAIVVYVFFYQNIYLVIENPWKGSSAGLFFNGSLYQWTTLDNAILFWSLFAWFIIFPLINNYVVNKQNPTKTTFVVNQNINQNIQKD